MLRVRELNGLVLTCVSAFHTVDAFGMAEFFPWQIKYGHASRADLNAFAATNFFAFERLSSQTYETEPVHYSHDGSMRTEISAPATRHIGREH